MTFTNSGNASSFTLQLYQPGLYLNTPNSYSVAVFSACTPPAAEHPHLFAPTGLQSDSEDYLRGIHLGPPSL